MSINRRFFDYEMRDGFKYCHERFSNQIKSRVAFIGGSITTQSWRVLTSQYISKMYPNTEFEFINAGIGGTDANLGAFRLPHDVFGHGQVDLLFLEFAVNGGGIRAMEGIIRQSKRLNNKIDICMLYLADINKIKDFNSGRIPEIVQVHQKVAEHYGIPSLFLYREIARRVNDGDFSWEQFTNDNVHPTDFGNKIYAQCVTDFLDESLKTHGSKNNDIPIPIDPFCYEYGHFVDLDEAYDIIGWERIKEWTTDKSCNFSPPADVLSAEKPKASLKLSFKGTAIGIYTLIGMDTGTIEYSIDGSEFVSIDPFDFYCPMFHRPQYTIFADELDDKQHTIVLKTGTKKNEKSLGYSIRILKFMVAGT
ncbi:MAG: SGNH/GDSL hydrolase family protein [bacterium]